MDKNLKVVSTELKTVWGTFEILPGHFAHFPIAALLDNEHIFSIGDTLVSLEYEFSGTPEDFEVFVKKELTRMTFVSKLVEWRDEVQAP